MKKKIKILKFLKDKLRKFKFRKGGRKNGRFISLDLGVPGGDYTATTTGKIELDGYRYRVSDIIIDEVLSEKEIIKIGKLMDKYIIYGSPTNTDLDDNYLYSAVLKNIRDKNITK